jgi:carboxyl-terminal processing protease
MNKKKKIGLVVLLLILCVAVGYGAAQLGNGTMSQSKKLSTLQMLIDQYYLEDADEEELDEGVFKGYVEQLDDPYSVYYTKEEYDDLKEDDSGYYDGIGVVVSQDTTTNEIMITRVFENGPAAEAGIKRYDVIEEVNGTSVSNMTLSEVVTAIRESEGKKVTLSIDRDGEKLTVESELAEVESEMVVSQMLEDKIGYIAIYEFIDTTYEQFQQACETLKEQGMEALVLDLRSNPGGLLDQVQEVADDFLEEGSVIVSTEDKQGNKEYLKANSDVSLDMPLVVLVDGYSASASEILAGVIKDYKIGTLMGQKTYGKGIVQRIFPLSDGSAVKLTIAKYYTPNGDYIHGKGIEPDIEIKDAYVEEKGDTIQDDTWVQQAVKELKSQMK